MNDRIEHQRGLLTRVAITHRLSNERIKDVLGVDAGCGARARREMSASRCASRDMRYDRAY
jgi:hypothetical protein